MSFVTKKYTRPVLLAEVRKLDVLNFVSVSAFSKALSPRVGYKSAKITALRNLIGTTNFRNALSEYSVIAKKELITLIKNA